MNGGELNGWDGREAERPLSGDIDIEAWPAASKFGSVVQLSALKPTRDCAGSWSRIARRIRYVLLSLEVIECYGEAECALKTTMTTPRRAIHQADNARVTLAAFQAAFMQRDSASAHEQPNRSR